jgi:hypothetical protein
MVAVSLQVVMLKARRFDYVSAVSQPRNRELFLA